MAAQIQQKLVRELGGKYGYHQSTSYRLGFFKRWITLSAILITIQRMAWFVLLIIIHCVAIYPVDSVTQPLKNWGPT